MKRLGAISRLFQSGIEDLKPVGPFQSEGVRADILRAVVVFLHASFEDLVRSQFSNQRGKWSFNAGPDLANALRRLNVSDPTGFNDLFPPLVQMAKRRIKIVHFADLPQGQSDGTNSWNVADDWQLVQWHLAVAAFFYRLRKAKGVRISGVEDRAARGVESSLSKNVEFARALLDFPKLPDDERRDGLKKIAAILEGMQQALRLDVKMFLGADGQPVAGAV